MVQQGKLLFPGELITDEKYLALTSYKQNYEGQTGRRFWKLVFVGQLLLVFVALLIFTFLQQLEQMF